MNPKLQLTPSGIAAAASPASGAPETATTASSEASAPGGHPGLKASPHALGVDPTKRPRSPSPKPMRLFTEDRLARKLGTVLARNGIDPSQASSLARQVMEQPSDTESDAETSSDREAAPALRKLRPAKQDMVEDAAAAWMERQVDAWKTQFREQGEHQLCDGLRAWYRDRGVDLDREGAKLLVSKMMRPAPIALADDGELPKAATAWIDKHIDTMTPTPEGRGAFVRALQGYCLQHGYQLATEDAIRGIRLHLEQRAQAAGADTDHVASGSSPARSTHDAPVENEASAHADEPQATPGPALPRLRVPDDFLFGPNLQGWFDERCRGDAPPDNLKQQLIDRYAAKGYEVTPDAAEKIIGLYFGRRAAETKEEPATSDAIGAGDAGASSALPRLRVPDDFSFGPNLQGWFDERCRSDAPPDNLKQQLIDRYTAKGYEVTPDAAEKIIGLYFGRRAAETKGKPETSDAFGAGDAGPSSLKAPPPASQMDETIRQWVQDNHTRFSSGQALEDALVAVFRATNPGHEPLSTEMAQAYLQEVLGAAQTRAASGARGPDLAASGPQRSFTWTEDERRHRAAPSTPNHFSARASTWSGHPSTSRHATGEMREAPDAAQTHAASGASRPDPAASGPQRSSTWTEDTRHQHAGSASARTAPPTPNHFSARASTWNGRPSTSRHATGGTTRARRPQTGEGMRGPRTDTSQLRAMHTHDFLLELRRRVLDVCRLCGELKDDNYAPPTMYADDYRAGGLTRPQIYARVLNEIAAFDRHLTSLTPAQRRTGGERLARVERNVREAEAEVRRRMAATAPR